MSELSELSLDIFKELAEDSLDEFIGYVPNKIHKTYQQTLQNQEVEEMTKIFKSIFTHLSYSVLNQDNLTEVLGEEKAAFVAKCYNENKGRLATTLLKEHNAEIKPVLENFDWKVKWIIGSSASTSLRYPIIQLDLSLINNENGKTSKKTVNCELTKDELDKLIAELETNQ